jgi:hypothetical protein
MMVAPLLYAYSRGMYSSRQIACGEIDIWLGHAAAADVSEDAIHGSAWRGD